MSLAVADDENRGSEILQDELYIVRHNKTHNVSMGRPSRVKDL